jgi:hypothetical protein
MEEIMKHQELTAQMIQLKSQMNKAMFNAGISAAMGDVSSVESNKKEMMTVTNEACNLLITFSQEVAGGSDEGSKFLMELLNDQFSSLGGGSVST